MVIDNKKYNNNKISIKSNSKESSNSKKNHWEPPVNGWNVSQKD